MNELKGKVTGFRWESLNIKRRVKITVESYDETREYKDPELDDQEYEDWKRYNREQDNRITIYSVQGSPFWDLRLGDSVMIKIEKE